MSIKKNYLFNTLFQILIILLPFITVPYTSRVLGPANLGINAYTNSIIQYFILIASLGVSMYGTRQIAYVKDNKEKRNRVFWDIFYLKLIVSIIVYFIFLLFVYIIYNKYLNIMLLQSIYIFSVSLDISWFYSGIERFDKLAIRNIFVKILSVVLIFLLVKTKDDLLLYISISIISELIGQLIMWLQFKNYIYFIPFNIKSAFVHFIPMIRLYIPQFIIQIYTVFDKTIIGTMTNESEVAYYDMAQKIIRILTIFAASLGTVMMPRISSLIEKNETDKIKDYLNKSFEFVCYLSIAMCFGLITVSKNFINLLLGDKFNNSTVIVQIMAPVIFLISVSNITGIQLMVPLKKEKEFTISVLLGATVSIISNIFMVYFFKSIGAGISFLLSEITVTIMQLIFSKDFWNFSYLIKILIKYLIGAIIMAVIISIVPIFSINNSLVILLIQIIIGLIFYFCYNILIRSYIQKYLLLQLNNFIKRMMKK